MERNPDIAIGKLPDCRMSFCKGYTQGGSNADVVIADAFIKNLTDGVDWQTAYEAVVSDAEGEKAVIRRRYEIWMANASTQRSHRTGDLKDEEISTVGTAWATFLGTTKTRKGADRQVGLSLGHSSTHMMTSAYLRSQPG
jgi:hypothetical protein